MKDLETFLGVQMSTWIKIKVSADCRKITVDELLEEYERGHPTSYYAWKELHGVMSEVLELKEGFDG